MNNFQLGFIAAWLFTTVLSDNDELLLNGDDNSPCDNADFHFSPHDTGPEIRDIARYAELALYHATGIATLMLNNDSAARDRAYSLGIDTFMVGYGSGFANDAINDKLRQALGDNFWDIGYYLMLNDKGDITGIDTDYTAVRHIANARRWA